jgi:hypothetical protein
MSIGPTSGVLGSAAGAPLSQTKGSEIDRAAREGAAADGRIDSEKKAEAAAGIGQTEGDEASSDRDADGRRLWELPPEEEEQAKQAAGEQSPPKRVKDPKGESGNTLDLTG